MRDSGRLRFEKGGVPTPIEQRIDVHPFYLSIARVSLP
jgi:hypothetical protein